MNRTLVDRLSDFCFAPTRRAAESLQAEGIGSEKVLVTGNTVIDALLIASNKARTLRPRIPGLGLAELEGTRLILVTCHRRESFGEPLEAICLAIRSIAEERSDVRIVYPVHPNPNVGGPVRRLLGRVERVHLIDPVGYLELVGLMDRCYLILTDSGGIQEEAPSLGKPVLVMRHVTERPEAVEAGCARLVGTDTDRIVAECLGLLDNHDEYTKMSRIGNPFGDGHAAVRIVDAIQGRFSRQWGS